MTPREIMEMAQLTVPPAWLDDRCKYLEAFAKLVAAKEREACAKVCDDIDAEYKGEDVLATWCSKAIRARGEA